MFHAHFSKIIHALNCQKDLLTLKKRMEIIKILCITIKNTNIINTQTIEHFQAYF